MLTQADLDAAATADGRGAGPPAAAALHRAVLPRLRSPGSAAAWPGGRRAATRSPTSRALRSVTAGSAGAPVATRYERVTFEPEHVRLAAQLPRRPARARPPAARRRRPTTIERHRRRPASGHGARRPSRRGRRAPLLVALAEEIDDGRGGTSSPSGSATSTSIRDGARPTPAQRPTWTTSRVRRRAPAAPTRPRAPGWPATPSRPRPAGSSSHQLPDYLAAGRRAAASPRLSGPALPCRQRLTQEINRWHAEARRS